MYKKVEEFWKDILINPTLACADRLNLDKELSKLSELGNKIIHIDIMDGHYVPNLCFDLPIINRVKDNYDFLLDVHLMVTNPEDYIDELATAGAEFVSFHLDATSFPIRLLKLIRSKGMKPGIVLNPAQNIDSLELLLEYLDYIVVMSVEPGFSGQSFIENAYEKVRRLSTIRAKGKLKFFIEVDGGIDEVNGKKCKELGADSLVAGVFAIFKGDLEKDYEEFKSHLADE